MRATDSGRDGRTSSAQGGPGRARASPRRRWQAQLAVGVLASGGLAAAALAADDRLPAYSLPTVVVAESPLPGSGVALDRVPANVQTVGAVDFARLHPVNLAGLLEQRIGSVSRNDAQSNPYQPDLQYRGFTASPVLGTPQGIAVYQNGVRLNEPFGETVNWDLIPDFAIASADLMAGSNPVFGLNALGGALALRMKNGFGASGVGGEVYGGSFGRVQATVEGAAALDRVAVYLGGRFFDEDGWRQHSPSQVRQAYGDVAWRSQQIELGVSVTAADNDLTGNGAAPVELLDADRTAVFTYPDLTKNRFVALAARGSAKATSWLRFDANLYVSNLHRDTSNGDVIDAVPCDGAPAALCIGEDGPAVLDQSGMAVPASLIESPAAFNTSTTQSRSFGAALQATLTHDVGAWQHSLLGGFAFDGGDTDFSSSSELGNLTPDRTVRGTGVIVHAGAEVTPVDLRTDNQFYGVYFSDILSFDDRLAFTVSGRFNLADIHLDDRLGSALDGRHEFQRFNPSVGTTYALLPSLTVYAGYAESNRAPSAAELGCADPAIPCRLPNAFLSDPPLQQVVARTIELGVRGHVALGAARGRGSVGLYRTDSDDDILFVSSSAFGRGSFQNAGRTRRQGVEVDLEGGLPVLSWLQFDWFASYAFIDPTFQSDFAVASPSNPQAEPDGTIQVAAGDTIPGIPRHQLKLGLQALLGDRLSVEVNVVGASGQYLRGDEANLNAPIAGYWLANIYTRLAITRQLELFVQANNVLNEEFATFGTFTETSEVPFREAPGAANPRAVGPGSPAGVFGGVRLRLGMAKPATIV